MCIIKIIIKNWFDKVMFKWLKNKLIDILIYCMNVENVIIIRDKDWVFKNINFKILNVFVVIVDDKYIKLFCFDVNIN